MSPTFSAAIILAAVVFLIGAVIDGVQSDECSTIKTMDNFNITGLLGIWNDVLISKDSRNASKTFSCVKDNFTAGENNTVVNNHTQSSKDSGFKFVITWNAYTPAILNFTIPMLGAAIVKYLLDTDYKGYAVLVYCDTNPDQKYANVLSKDKELSDDADDKVRSALETAGVSYDDLAKVDQSNC